MGLQTVREKKLFLTLAGGSIWDRSADESHPYFAIQKYKLNSGEEKERRGAQYESLSGFVKGVEFRTHKDYGENINVSIESDGETFILSISTNNRNYQSMAKGLLTMDFNKEILIKPYDFIGQDGKRAQGISFKQNGEKLDLRNVEIAEEFRKEKEFFGDKTQAGKRKIQRYFEDLSDWFTGEIEEKVIPQLVSKTPVQEDVEEKSNLEEVVQESKPKTPSKTEEKRPSLIKMRKEIKAYIEDNYDQDFDVKSLNKDQVNEWYDLVQAEEELPLDDFQEANVDDLDKQLGALLNK